MAIPNTIVANHHLGTTTEDIVTSIDVDDFPFLAEMMNGLYSNTHAAPLREYATNAWDSHVDAGNTGPIEITLPTPFAPQLVIRDYGLGMSVEDLRAVYSKYGRSLKRDNNDVAGQLGMGSKSGLSYAPSFTIQGVKNGVRVVAIFTKNEQGLGVIKVLDTSATDEANGVTITIPVENDHIASFAKEAKHLFSFWAPGTVLVNGKAPEVPEWHDSALWLDTERHTCLVRNDKLDSSYVIMGNVPYPVADVTFTDRRRGTVSRRFVARLNIGDVDFAPSRETLKMTRRTTETLAELREFIAANYDRAFSSALAEASTAWDEMKLRISWSNLYGQTPTLRGSTDAPVWEYNPNPSYGRRTAKKHAAISYKSLLNERTVVVTGFTAKAVSTDARARLRSYAPADQYVILTKGVSGIGALDGRPNVVNYADVIAATAPAKGSTVVKRGPKVETRYSTYGGCYGLTQRGQTAAELAALVSDGKLVLYINPGENLSVYNTVLDDDTYIVSLYSSAQLPRILRLVPGIVHAREELNARRDKVAAAITNDDRLWWHTRNRLSSTFGDLPADRVDDPVLRRFIKIYQTPKSRTLMAAHSYQNINVGPPRAKDQMPDFMRLYPLLSRLYGGATSDEDVILYLNAKYRDRCHKEAVATQAEALKAALAAATLTDELAA